MLGAGKPDKDEPSEETQNWHDMAVIPMTFPMSIGGTTAAYIVSATAFAQNIIDLVAISIVVAFFGGVIWLTHFLSPPLSAECNVVGFELVEVAPLLDPTYVTAQNGSQVIAEAVTGIAMRKKGITERWYLDPRTSGQDPVPGQRTD